VQGSRPPQPHKMSCIGIDVGYANGGPRRSPGRLGVPAALCGARWLPAHGLRSSLLVHQYARRGWRLTAARRPCHPPHRSCCHRSPWRHRHPRQRGLEAQHCVRCQAQACLLTARARGARVWLRPSHGSGQLLTGSLLAQVHGRLLWQRAQDWRGGAQRGEAAH